MQRPVPIRLGRHALIRLESDAPNGYVTKHRHAGIAFGCVPQDLATLESKSDFQGGRACVTLRASESAKAGETGTATIFLTTPIGESFSASIKFEVKESQAEAEEAVVDELGGMMSENEPDTERDALRDEVERLKKENLKLKQAPRLKLRVSKKGAVSLYGLGRFPVTLYKNQWLKVLDMQEEIREFIRQNNADLSVKEGEQGD